MIIFAYCVRLGLAFVLVLAAIQKAMGFAGFRAAVAQYAAIPNRVEGIAAGIILCVESVAGLCLLVGYQPRIALAATAALLVLFGIAVSGELVRGRRFECGCFGGGRGLISWELPIRNLMMAGAAAAAARAFSGDASGVAPASTTIACAVTAGALLISYVTARSGTRLFRRHL